MMGLLSWLYSIQQRVYNIFGGIYQSVVNAALYAWNWAYDQGQAALNNALRAIGGAETWLQNWALGLFASISYVVTYVETFVRGYTATLSSNILNTVNNLVGSLWSTVNGIINTNIPNAIVTAETWVRGVEAVLLGDIANLENSVKSGSIFPDSWKPIFDFLTNASNWTAIQGLVSLFTSLVAFFQNPVGFILEQAKFIFQEFLCWVVSYGLGTVKYDLPPWPVWYTAAGGIIAPPPPSAAASGLVPPLSRLWVSGYTFNNPPGHMGVDFGPTDPFVVYAAHDGTVTYAAWSTVGYGNTITLQGSRWWTRYGHLQSFRVGVGESVKAGQVIAIGDTTGNSTGNHLHFELKDNGTFVNPLLYF